MPTDPAELERELFDFENAAPNTTYGMSVGGPCWHTHLAALRQYADPRTALALRVLAILENPTDAQAATIARNVRISVRWPDNQLRSDRQSVATAFHVLLTLAKRETP